MLAINATKANVFFINEIHLANNNFYLIEIPNIFYSFLLIVWQTKNCHTTHYYRAKAAKAAKATLNDR